MISRPSRAVFKASAAFTAGDVIIGRMTNGV